MTSVLTAPCRTTKKHLTQHWAIGRQKAAYEGRYFKGRGWGTGCSMLISERRRSMGEKGNRTDQCTCKLTPFSPIWLPPPPPQLYRLVGMPHPSPWCPRALSPAAPLVLSGTRVGGRASPPPSLSPSLSSWRFDFRKRRVLRVLRCPGLFSRCGKSKEKLRTVLCRC